MQSDQTSSGNQNEGDGGGGFFEKLLSVFFGAGDPEREKKRLLKILGKNLTKDRYKFYNPKGPEILPAFARLVYETYRGVYAVRKLIQPTDSSGVLKSIVIESRMTEKQQELRDRMDERTIRERAKQTDVKTIAEDIRDVMITFVSTFDGNRVKEINSTYNQLQSFVEFCYFDYYFTLRKFDSAIGEDSFGYKPKFEAINGEYVIDDVQDFLVLLEGLPLEADWDVLFDTLKAYRGMEMVDRDLWKKLVKVLLGVQESRILEQIVQHAKGDPHWTAKKTVHASRIIEPFLNDTKHNVEGVLQKLVDERRSNKIEQLVQKVFNTTVVARAKNYTPKVGMSYQKGDLPGFLHTEALNYLKAYLLDYFKKDVRQIVQDLLIVRGKWVTNIQAQQLSDAYHGVLSVSEKLLELDEGLSDEGEAGQRLRRAASRVVDRDPSSQKALREHLNQINAEVLRLVTEAAQNLIIIGKNLKSLVDDIDKKEPQFVTNWKELDNAAEGKLNENMANSYRQLYFLVQLLQVYTAKN